MENVYVHLVRLEFIVILIKLFKIQRNSATSM